MDDTTGERSSPTTTDEGLCLLGKASRSAVGAHRGRRRHNGVEEDSGN